MGELIYESNETGNRTIEIDIFNYTELFYENNYTFWVNVTTEGNETHKWFWFNTGNEVYCMALAFDTSQFGLFIIVIIFIFFFTLAEWKKDFIYFIISGALSLELGIVLLTFPDIHIMFSLILFGVAGYCMFISFLYLPIAKQYTAQIREYFGIDNFNNDD